MLAFSIDYYGVLFRATQSVGLFCTYDFLKCDEKMIEHLEESTNVVKSNQKMIWAIIVNIIVVALLITLNMFIPDNRYFLVGVFCLMVITSSALLYQIFRKL